MAAQSGEERRDRQSKIDFSDKLLIDHVFFQTSSLWTDQPQKCPRGIGSKSS
jgi:hypothetical protein